MIPDEYRCFHPAHLFVLLFNVFIRLFYKKYIMQSSLINMFTCILIAAASLYLVPDCGAQARPKKLLLALSKKDHTLAIVDPLSLKVIARIPVGPDPHEVIASSDGSTAYVSNMGEDLHELDIIDLIGQKALPSFDTKFLIGLHGLDFKGGKVWFTAQGADAVGRYDPATAQIDWCMGTGQDRTHMIYVTPDEKNIYVTNVSAGTVSILQDSLVQPHPMPDGKLPPWAKPKMTWLQTVIPVSKGSEGFDVSPDGSRLWTVASEDGKISIIDIASKKVTATIDAKAFGANRLKFTPDGKRVLISTLRSGDLFVYDVTSHKEIKKINIGHGAAGILVDNDGSRAFVGCTADDYVAVIDLKKLEVTGHIDVGGGPDGLAWAIQ
jgi:YVTN family beta-propeller protein